MLASLAHKALLKPAPTGMDSSSKARVAKSILQF